MLGLVASVCKQLNVWPVSNFAQQPPTTWNRGRKRTQQVTSNNVGSCWPTTLRPFARGFKGLTSWKGLRKRQFETPEFGCIYRSENREMTHEVIHILSLYFSLRNQPTFRATSPLVSPRNNVWQTSAEILYWWRVTTKNWVVLLIGHSAREICFNQSEALPWSG